MTAADARQSGQPGAFAPLDNTLFRVLWISTVVGNIGSFMRDVASQWLVTDLSPSPAAVALIQAAGTLPIFFFAIPAGVLTDILDRRKFLIAVQLLLAVVSLTMGLLAWSGTVSVWDLTLLTFLGGTGAALMLPTWQAIVPELVPASELKAAIALNSLGINIARSLGPALGGLTLALAGASMTYGFAVLSNLCVIAALVCWKRPMNDLGAPREHFGGALKAGLRYAVASPEMHRILWRTVVFFVFGSAVWALMPVVARYQMAGGPAFYGLMLGFTGAGAIAGAFLLPMARAKLGADILVLAASLLMAATSAALAMTSQQAAALAIMFCLGLAWIAVLVTLNTTMQSVLPNWVRGRGLALYFMAFNGAMAGGSLVWGGVAQAIGTPFALLSSAACLAVVAVLVHFRPLPAGDVDLSPSMHWPEPASTPEGGVDRGPVIVTVEYHVAPQDRTAFRDIARSLSVERRRDGAYAWGLAEDAEDPQKITEWFFVVSWAEHLRQHHRVSKSAAAIQSALLQMHGAGTPPLVRHLVALPASGPSLPIAMPATVATLDQGEHQ
jgi:MFS family permease